MSTHLIRILAAWQRIGENVIEFLDHSLQFCNVIDPVSSVPGNATPHAVRKVPARCSCATSHAHVLQQLTVAQISDQRKKQPIFFWKILRSCVPQAKKNYGGRALGAPKHVNPALRVKTPNSPNGGGLCITPRLLE